MLEVDLSGITASAFIASDGFGPALAASGALLLRGGVDEPARALGEAARAVLGAPMSYRFFVTPRRDLEDGFLSATDVPPARTVRFHNECSYLPAMPRYLLLVCVQPSAAGGRTLLARTVDVARAIPGSIVQAFSNRRVAYRWVLPDVTELSRKLGCRTHDEAFVKLAAIGVEAHLDARGRLQMTSVRPALVRLDDGTLAWANHLWALHRSAIPSAVLSVYSRQHGADVTPHDACFEDGSAIDPAVVDAVGRAYACRAQAVSWQARDVLVIDNLRFAHAREPYQGARDVRVQMFAPTQPVPA
jgi:hypothetical protein